MHLALNIYLPYEKLLVVLVAMTNKTWITKEKNPYSQQLDDKEQCRQKNIEMADELLEKAGLYVDELYSLRVIEQQIANETHDLKEECSVYSESKY